MAFPAVALVYRPSVFIVLFLFLTLGFLLKLIVPLGLDVWLIEPVGSFGGSATEWDKALAFSTAGLLGPLLARSSPCGK